jgi:signal peptide peptidase SppA
LARLRIPGFREQKPVVAVVRLAGTIGRGHTPLRPGLGLASLNVPLERAFKLKGLKAVALSVNSPGGAAAQSSLIHKRIRALAEEHKVPVIAFAEDVAASGGYWLACAADEIYADESSIIGSIGVVSAGFGFPQLLRRLGVERRMHTAGSRKAMLDPFLREDAGDVAHLDTLQAEVHGAFKEMVRARRAGRLKGDEDELFSGAFWTGARALELGLIDGIGELTSEMRARYGERVRFRPIGERRGWLKRRLAPGSRTPLGWHQGGAGDLAADLVSAVEERALWGRFGL